MKRVLAALVTVVAVLAGCSGGQQAGDLVRFAPADRLVAPAIQGDLLGGASFDLAQHRGTVVVVNFWASWCAPCRLEAPALEAVHQALPEVEFLGINIRDDEDKALAFQEDKSSYPSIFDPAGRIALEFTQVPPNTIPATIVIDADGKIAAVIRRAVQEDELHSIISEILGESS